MLSIGDELPAISPSPLALLTLDTFVLESGEGGGSPSTSGLEAQVFHDESMWRKALKYTFNATSHRACTRQLK